MANKLPILSSKYNGCWPEYVTKKNGWVFDPLDVNDFVAKLKQSFECSQLEDFGKTSAKIIGNHNADTAANSIFKTLDFVVNK